MRFEFVEEGKKQSKRYEARIKVIGVGGAGGNAINNMINGKLRGVELIVANTDCQDLDRSLCPMKIQLGPTTTMGLGAGADPDIGRSSAEESLPEIQGSVDGSDMVFITAGMGGGTGTGASPVIARQCKEAGALTVAVATKPFKFEGERRMKRALEGIAKLKEEVDSLIIIPNERLKALGTKTTPFTQLFARADEVLMNAVRGISDLILSNGFINLDFADVRKVMSQNGTAIMGMGTATGEKRASEAAQMAINSPLLEDISISGARGLLMNITGPSTMTMEEIDEACNYIKNEVNEDAEIFWGMVLDDDLEDEIRVTVIATGINGEATSRRYSKGVVSDLSSKVVKLRDITANDVQQEWTVRMNGECLDVPTWQRKGSTLSDTAPQLEPKAAKKGGILSRFLHKDSLDYPTFLRLKLD